MYLLLLLITTLTTYSNSDQIDCEISEELIRKRHFKMQDVKTFNVSINSSISFECEDSYGLLAHDQRIKPTNQTNKFDKSNINIPTKVEAICQEIDGTLIFIPDDDACDDLICDEFCKKYYTHDEMMAQEAEKKFIYKNLPSKKYFWPGETFDAHCQHGLFLEKKKITKGRTLYESGENLRIALKKCTDVYNCEPTFEMENWKTKYNCVQPTCNPKYVENALNMVFTDHQNKIFTANSWYNFKCIENHTLLQQVTIGQISCSFDNETLTSYWANADSHSSELKCKKFCLLDEKMKKTLAVKKYELISKLDHVHIDDTFEVQCMNGYVPNRNVRTDSMIILATCTGGYNFQIKFGCRKERDREFFDNWWSIPITLICILTPLLVFALFIEILREKYKDTLSLEDPDSEIFNADTFSMEKNKPDQGIK